MLSHTVFGVDTIVVGVVVSAVTLVRFRCMPPSILALLIGMCMSPFLQNRFGFTPEVFLYLMLPPIVLRSGIEFKWSTSRRTWKTALLFATVGTVMSAAYIFFGCVVSRSASVGSCARMGSVLSSTDPVAVLSILSNYNVPEKMKSVLENEALTNDGIAAMLTHIITSSWSASDATVNFVVGILTTVTLGSMVGYLSASTDKPLAILGLALSTYATCELMGGSGILAMFIFGITHRCRSAADDLRKIVVPLAELADIYCVFALGTEARNIVGIDIYTALNVTLACVIGRIIHVFVLGYGSCQGWYSSHLTFMSFCCSRGALSYALARSTETGDGEDVIVTTTVLFVVLVTTFMTTTVGFFVRELF